MLKKKFANFEISVYCNSCHNIFFGLILASFLYLSFYSDIPTAGWNAQEIERERKEEIMRPEKSKNCMNCRTQKIVKSGTSRLTSGFNSSRNYYFIFEPFLCISNCFLIQTVHFRVSPLGLFSQTAGGPPQNPAISAPISPGGECK